MDIRVFPPNEKTFVGGVPLLPLSATVTQSANGNYQLNLSQARDDQYERHKLLINGAVIVCDVPSKCLPMKHIETTTGIVDRYVTVGKANQVKETKINAPEYIIKAQIDGYLRTHPEATHTEAYDAIIGQFKKTETHTQYSDVPCYKSETLSDVIDNVSNGTNVNMIKDGETWVFGITKSGVSGYFKKTDLYYVGRVQGEVWDIVDDDTTISTTQPFRIISVKKVDGKRIDVVAQHIYFDASSTQLPDHEFNNTNIESVCEFMNQNGVIKYHAGAIKYITEKAEGSSVALASTLCDNYNLQLVRDGFDAYFLDADNTQRTITISTGYNAKALTINSDTSNLVTRWIPVVDDEDGEPVDSEYINDYPLIYTKRVKGETLEECTQQISKDIENNADQPKISVSAECLSGSIDACSVFDTAIIRDSLFGENLTAKVNYVTFDCLTKHVKQIKLGESSMRFSANIFSSVHGSWQSIK